MKGWRLLELIRSWKKVDSIRWETDGSDWEPDRAGIIVSADGKEWYFHIGSPAVTSKVNWFDAVCIYLMVNKVLQLAGRKETFSVAGTDQEYVCVEDAIQTAMRAINEQKQQKSENLADDCGN